MAGAAPSVSGLPLALLGITGTHGGRTDPLTPNAGVMVPNNPGAKQGKTLGKTLAGVAAKPGSVPGYFRGPGVLPPVGTPAPGATIPPIAPGASAMMLDQNGIMGLGSGYRPPSGPVRQTFGPMPLAGNPVNSKGVAESVFASNRRHVSQPR